MEKSDANIGARPSAGASSVSPVERAGGSLRALAAYVRRRFRREFPRTPTPDAGELRLSSSMRLLLATTALVVTGVHPPEVGGSVAATYAVLAVYVAHAAAFHVMAVRRGTVPMAHQYALPWVDVGVCAVLIGLNGSHSRYFVLFFFGILGASLRGGFALGTATTLASIVLFVTVGYLGHPGDTEFELDQFLIRLTSLAVLGYVIASRGGYEVRLRRRLALLREIGTLSNPRFGPNRMLARGLESLRAFYDADVCAAILTTQDASGHELRRATRAATDAAHDVQEIPAPLAAALLSLGDELVCFRPGSRGAVRVSSRSGTTTDVTSDVSRRRAVAELLGVQAYLTVPLRAGSVTQGRLYVGADDAAFDHGDEKFLLQAADTIMPVAAHLALIERMATRAAEDERHRIALDIHDRLIQPYIGLQMGIGAVRQMVSSCPDQGLPRTAREGIAALAELSDMGIQQLRSYTSELRGAPAAGGLLESLRRFATRFHEATGIRVTLDVHGELRMDDRLATEIFSMACEAVSNVRRHTDAPSTTIALRAAGPRVELRVENPAGPDVRGKTFLPRSIAERAAAINGTVRVEVTEEGGTSVVVEVPL